MQEFIEKINRLHNFIQNDAARIVGKEAVDHYKQSFQNEAFSDKSKGDEPWKEVKRRIKPRMKNRAAARRKILTGDTGELADSITYSVSGRYITIKSDKAYAGVHNKGLKAGRGTGFKMPKRQFIGRSALLINRTNKILKRRMSNILNR